MHTSIRIVSSFGFALALVIAGCTTPASRPPAPEHPLLVRAERELLAGNEAEALRLYRAYRVGFEPSPFVSECRYWEGAILLKQGKLDEAERSFRACLADPRSRFLEAAAWVGFGDCRFAADDYSGAIQAYQRALDLRVPDARNDYAIYRLGVARQRVGDWEAGRACYQLVLHDHAKSPLRVRAEQRLRYPDRYLHLQVGAFQLEESAKQLEVYLHEKGLIARTVNVVNGAAPYLVWVGDYSSFALAQAALPDVRKLCGESVVLVP